MAKQQTNWLRESLEQDAKDVEAFPPWLVKLLEAEELAMSNPQRRPLFPVPGPIEVVIPVRERKEKTKQELEKEQQEVDSLAATLDRYEAALEELAWPVDGRETVASMAAVARKALGL
jgi:hypothetical protein